jgi:serine/threonine protein kinase
MVRVPGDVTGPYEITSLLGRGGMGAVYLARDQRLHRQVALKFIHPRTTDPSDTRRRMLREARAASALNHPNICHVYDVGEQDDSAWIAMEYVEGRPLHQLIPPGGLAVDDVLGIACPIADALAHAHDHGILHRDLKGANVIVDHDGRPRVLDFGIASRLPEAIAREVTQSAAPLSDAPLSGTLAYMAPEVIKGELPDRPSDLWSLGVLLYEMLAGRRPFRGETAFELASSILHESPEPLPARVPPSVAAVVSRLLSKRPEGRYRTAAEVRAALESLQHGRGATRTRTRRTSVIFASLAALAMMLAVVERYWQRSGTGAPQLSQHRLVTASVAAQQFPAFAPDGSTIAFAAPDTSGTPQIWVKKIAQGNAIQITSGAHGAARPRWSPAGDRIFYGVAGEGIWSVSPLGGDTRRVLEVGDAPDLSRDGSRLVFERGGTIWTSGADGSDPHAVPGALFRYAQLPTGPALSPDGRTIAFFHPPVGPNGDLWILPVAGGTPRRLTTDVREGGWPVWTPDGRWIIYSSARAGSRTLWCISTAGGEPIPLTTGSGDDDQPDVSRDGRQVIYTNTRNTWEVRSRNLKTGEERTLLDRRTETIFPRFSPDGKRIVFFGRADYAVGIFTMNSDGSDVRQITAGRELNHMPQWSPDAQSIYFFQAVPTQTFRRVPAVGGTSTEFRRWSWQLNNTPLFDPTGRLIAFTKQNPPGSTTGEPEALIIEEVATGRTRALPGPHAHIGGWSADGQQMIVWRHPAEVQLCEVKTLACRTLTTGILAVWPGDRSRVYVMRPTSATEPQELWSVSINGGDERREALLGSFRPIDRFFDVSRDGLVVWTPYLPGQPELWTAMIK